MRTENQPAFILHARAWRETSLLVEAFTRDHGRVGLVARGVRNPKSRLSRSSLQPLQPLLLDWSTRGELGTLIQAEQAGTPWRLGGDALIAGMYVNELVLKLSSRNDPHPRAFAAYTECLARLAEETDIAWTLRRFERDLLADLGYALLLTHTAEGV
ncbi:MAG TPA: DNA repair protein RecO, partial [Rhodanobacteraceae bacterium]|nr:DNA repair protein RecO [Rhodanobacteraceae bacterium]